MYLLAIAIAPVIVIVSYFYYKDKFEKEPLLMLFYAFVGGALSIIPAIVLEWTWKHYGFNGQGNNLNLAFYAYIVVGLSEEFCKFLFVKRIINRPYVNEPYDAIIYSVMVSMGFAFVENLLYVYQSGAGVGLLRAFTAVPAHATFAVVMGYYLGRGKFNSDFSSNAFIGLSCAVLLHGSYDYFLMINNIPLIQIGAFVSLIIGLKLSSNAIKIHNRNSPFMNS